MDDDADVRESFGETLSEHFQIQFARDGADALETLRDRPVDAVVLDLRMPKVDGWEFLRKLDECAPGLQRPRVLVVSAIADPEARSRALKAGADDIVSKPIFGDELVIRLTRLTAGVAASAPAALAPAIAEPPLVGQEAKIFKLLGTRPNELFSREEICHHLWGEYSERTDKNLDPSMSHLRRQISPLGWHLKTVYGKGYMLFRAS